MKKPKYLAFDTETGGLNPNTSPILTAYFAVVGEDFGIIEEIFLKIRPEAPFEEISKEALGVNKIDIAKHLESPDTLSRGQASEKLYDLIKKYQPRKYPGLSSKLRPLGQNIEFDIDMIRTQLIPKEDWEKYVHYSKVDTKMIADFLKDAGWLPPEIGRLDSMVRHFDIPMLDTHDAKNDTLMTIEVYKKFTDLLSQRKNTDFSVDILSLLEK